MAKKENYISIYAEDFDTDIWEEYCRIAGVPESAIKIKIRFDDKDVEYVDGSEKETDEEDQD